SFPDFTTRRFAAESFDKFIQYPFHILLKCSYVTRSDDFPVLFPAANMPDSDQSCEQRFISLTALSMFTL
ncbi:MAG: hypothetical protein K2P42_18125, partial [Lachnospiraceae bacterium]|nr:hypothetical protein [Lachnospiraceae bacterium]